MLVELCEVGGKRVEGVGSSAECCSSRRGDGLKVISLSGLPLSNTEETQRRYWATCTIVQPNKDNLSDRVTASFVVFVYL